MNSSSTHIHVNPNSPKDAFPNVINFRFSHLKKYKSYKQVKGEPKKCAGCDAVLLNNWTCRFCNTENDTNCELPESNDVEFILEQKKYSDENARYIVFCLDTSGSMGEPVIIDKFVKLPTDEVSKRRFQKLAEEMRNAIGEDISFEDQYRVGGNLPDGKRLVTRLDMIQTGVIKNLENIQRDNGDKKVAIVTFNNEVCIVGDGLIDKVILNDEAMNSKRTVETFVQLIKRVEHIGHNPGLLINKVLEFENKGQTALGPALYASVLLASRRSGSTVLLFTDGLANIGLGNLYDENQFEASRKFYQDIAEIASSRGVTVSIATLEGVDSGLELIGQVAQKSGGDIFSVDPTNLNNIVLEFNETTTVGATIATNMALSIYVPKEFIIKDYKEGITNTNKITKQIGNIKKNTEIGFEIVGTKNCRNLIGLQIPIQIQLSYKSDDGSKVLRVISVFKEISNNQKLVEKNSDRCVLGSYVIRTKANLKNHSNELVLLAKQINELKVEKEDNFDKEKFQREILKVGIKLPGLEAPALPNSMNTNNSVDSFVSSMNRASQMTSENLRKNKNS